MINSLSVRIVTKHCLMLQNIPRLKRFVTMPFVKESPFYHAVQRVLKHLTQSGVLSKIQSQALERMDIKERMACDSGAASFF